MPCEPGAIARFARAIKAEVSRKLPSACDWSGDHAVVSGRGGTRKRAPRCAMSKLRRLPARWNCVISTMAAEPVKLPPSAARRRSESWMRCGPASTAGIEADPGDTRGSLTNADAMRIQAGSHFVIIVGIRARRCRRNSRFPRDGRTRGSSVPISPGPAWNGTAAIRPGPASFSVPEASNVAPAQVRRGRIESARHWNPWSLRYRP